MSSYLWWMLGYEEEEGEPDIIVDDETKRVRYEMLKQVKNSKLKLNKTFADIVKDNDKNNKDFNKIISQELDTIIEKAIDDIPPPLKLVRQNAITNEVFYPKNRIRSNKAYKNKIKYNI